MALDDGGGFIFGGNTGLTYEQLKQRRAIAQALASRQGGFPKNKGEGMTYLGESLAQGLQDLALSRKEAAYNKAVSTGLGSLRAPGDQPPAAPVIAPRAPPIVPPPAPPPVAPSTPMSDAGGDVGLSVADTGAPDVPASALATAPMTPDAPASFNDRFAAATPPPVGLSPDLTGGNVATPQDLTAVPPAVSPRDRVAAAMQIQPAAPVSTPDVPLPRGDPRTTGGVRATMEAALSRGGQSPTAIAGIERNVRDESGFDPANVTRGDQPRFTGEAHHAHGLYQEGGDEWNNYVKWIDKNAPGSDWRDPNLQSRFLADRLQDPQYANANAGMNAIGASPGQSANAFLRGYLKPAAGPMAQRSAQYLREDGGGTYADRQLAQDSSVSPAAPGARLASGGGREGGAPVDDTRDLITAAMLDQPKPQQQQDQQSQDLLPDVAGMSNRTILPQRPTAALGRTGVASDTSLPALAPMGALTGAPGPAVAPPMPPAQDPREAITQALLSQQGPGAMDQGATPAATQSPTAVAAPPPAAMTDIQPAPIGAPGQQLAAGPPPPPIPGPLAPPVARPPTPMQPQAATPQQFAQPPIAPQPPPIPPISQAELRAQALMSQFPDNPVVQQRAQQALADAEKQRLMPYQRDIEKYKADLGLYNQQYNAWQENQRKQPMEDLELRAKQQELSDKQAAAARSTRLGGIPDQVFSAQIEKSADASKGIPGATQAIANARQAIKDGMYTGSAAEMELSLGKIARAAGFEPKDASKLANTEAFKAYMAGVTAQARQSLVGSNQISNADLAAAQQASGGKITMEPESVLKILDSLERINTATAVQHQGKLLTYAGDDPNAQRAVFGTFGLPMESIVPAGAKQRLIEHPELAAEFDSKFNTPGLARRILGQR